MKKTSKPKMRFIRAVMDKYELREIGHDKPKYPLALAAVIDLRLRSMSLMLADGRLIIGIKLKEFTVSGDGTAPEFEKLEIIDHGHTIKLGKYEAGTDSVVR